MALTEAGTDSSSLSFLSFAHDSHGWFHSYSALAFAFAAASSAFFLAHLTHGVFPSASFLAFSLAALSAAFLAEQAAHGVLLASSGFEESTGSEVSSSHVSLASLGSLALTVFSFA